MEDDSTTISMSLHLVLAYYDDIVNGTCDIIIMSLAMSMALRVISLLVLSACQRVSSSSRAAIFIFETSNVWVQAWPFVRSVSSNGALLIPYSRTVRNYRPLP